MNGGMAVQVNLSGDKSIMSKFGNLEKAVVFTEALRKVGENLVEYFAGQVFESHGGVFGTPWQSLSSSTIAYKSKHYRQFAAVPLQATGTMKRSFKYSSSALHLEITNEAPYFKYHQSTEPRNKIPRRPMFAINRDIKSIVKHSIEEEFIKHIGAL